MAASLQGVSLTKAYRLGDEQVYALDGFSLDIHPGSLVAVLGRPRSGKSTLLHVLAGLQRPDAGQVHVDGLELTSLEDDELAQARSRQMGFVFQAFNLLPNETVISNVEVPLKQQGVGAWDRRERAEEALNTVGLGARGSYKLGQLSAGQRQMVALARAVVHNPGLIFADEPARALDSTSREEVMGLLQKLHSMGNTIVVSTNESGVANYCERVVRIAEGRLIDDAPASRQRVIPASRIPGTPPRTEEREVVVCSRCSYGNFSDQQACRRCEFPLELTKDEEEAIEGRLGGTGNKWLGVESASDEDEDGGELPRGELISELKEVPFLAGLGAKNLLKVISALEEHQVPTGMPIVRQAEPGDSFYILRSGSVEVVLEVPGRAPTSLAQLGPKQGFGEMALLTGLPRSATVIATSDVRVWRLPNATFQRLLEENISLSLYFNRVLSQRLRSFQERAVSLL